MNSLRKQNDSQATAAYLSGGAGFTDIYDWPAIPTSGIYCRRLFFAEKHE
jgi:hypothetical protein